MTSCAIPSRITSQYYTQCLHCGKKSKSGSLAEDLDVHVEVERKADLAESFFELQKATTVEGVECDSEYVEYR